MITLYLARHGQTEENIARIFQGHMPGTLTVEGIAQAEALRDTLRNISLDAVVSSDLKRCVDTARIAVEGRNLPWEKTVLLREIDWGSWTGLAIKEVDLQHFPADVETEATSAIGHVGRRVVGSHRIGGRRRMRIPAGPTGHTPIVAILNGLRFDHCGEKPVR